MFAINGFGLFLLAFVLACVAVPLWNAARWHGLWRILAALPVLVVLFVIVRILVDTRRDPTSHNLWPFEVIMWGAIALGVAGVLRLARRMLGLKV
jgi:membrane protein implicated in regulation of membrane protease activity